MSTAKSFLLRSKSRHHLIFLQGVIDSSYSEVGVGVFAVICSAEMKILAARVGISLMKRTTSFDFAAQWKSRVAGRLIVVMVAMLGRLQLGESGRTRDARVIDFSCLLSRHLRNRKLTRT